MCASHNKDLIEERKQSVPGKSKSRNREESRRRIMQAGFEIFSEVGYDDATTKSISARAGLNEGLLFRYFNSKENLLFEILKFFTEKDDQDDVYPAGKTVEKEIMNFFKARLEFATQAQSFIKVMLIRSLLDPKINKLIAEKSKPRFSELLTKRLVAFKEKGDISSEIQIIELVSIITHQVFMVTFMDRVLFTKSTTTCLKQFSLFAKIIVKGIV